MITQEQKEKAFADFDKSRQKADLAFADIQNIFEEDNIDYRGDFGLMHPAFNNILVWAGFNKDAVNLINEYMTQHRLAYYPVSIIVYVIAGRVLNYPLAKRMEYLDQYKKLHWLPVVLIPYEEAQKRMNEVLAENKKK